MSHIEPHDEFLELCALSTSGQLTGEEQKRLQEHLVVCPSCRQAIEQYRALVRHAIPAIAAQDTPEEVADGPLWSPQSAERALFERIAREEEAEGLTESETKERVDSPKEELPRLFAGAATWRRIWGLYAAGIVLSVALGICAYRVGMNRGVSTARAVYPQRDMAKPHSGGPQKPQGLEEQLSDAGHERELARAEIDQRERVIRNLRRQIEEQSVAMGQMKLAQQRLEHDLNAGNVDREHLLQQRADLAQKFETAQASAESLQRKLDNLRQLSSQEAVKAKLLESKVNDLTESLRERDAALEQQQQLLAHDRDIRELMGARDLYIAEVYDVARTGVTQKPYGRVFYTKGKSLIFYAYDLDQEAGVKNASSFQVWGRRGPDPKQALNMGIFYIDNAAKKRWVLKFDDPKTLAQIDAVFVTVEPNGGSHRPSGKSLLFAYLRVEPNHP